MRRFRGLVAGVSMLVAGTMAMSCGSGTTSTPGGSPDSGAGGATETGGTSSADASAGGGGAGGSSSGGTGGVASGGSSADAASGTGGAADAGPVHLDAGPPSLCGNGKMDKGEECDDHNTTNNDGCDGDCRFTCTATDTSRCADGNFCNGEELCGTDHRCIPSAAPLADGVICGETQVCKGGVCRLADAVCGDGLVVPPEECDKTDPGCKSCRFVCLSTDPTRDCKTGVDPCGGASTCDDFAHTCSVGTPLKDLYPCGTGTAKKACVSGVCTDKYCSNGKVDAGEECDDGNLAKGDGCEPDCKFTCLASDATRDCHSGNICVANGACDAQTHKCSALLPKAAGTSCGIGKNCIEANCKTVVCGDGIVGTGEQCDDGNPVNGDGCDTDCTPSCVTPATDCTKAAPACEKWTCGTSPAVCVAVTDSTKVGACTTGAGAGTCKAVSGATPPTSACTGGTCGNGTTDAGEQCDDGNTTNGDGCDANCQYSCQADGDCNDGDTCNGTETCATITAGKQCKAGTSLADGTSCGAAGSGHLCLRSSCHLSFCGDRYTDAAAGEQCDPPNTVGCDASCKALATCKIAGDWAMKVTVSVTWGDGVVLMPGTGTIEQWAKLTIKQTGTSFTADLKACGLVIPDFHTSATFFSEWYGTAFPNAAFDSVKMPVFPVTGQLGNVAPGASVDMAPTATVLGLTIGSPASPFGAWPDTPADLTPATGYTIVDHDNDTKPGITALAKSGPKTFTDGTPATTYSDIIWQVVDATHFKRADKLQLVVRQIAAESGTLTSCTTMTGGVSATVDNHIIGCHDDTGTDCTDPPGGNAWDLLDGVRPTYVVDDSKSAFTAVKITDGASCGAVRKAVP